MFSGKDLAGTSLVVLLWWLSGKSTPADAGDVGGGGSIPSWGRSSGVGNGNPLQYSCLEKIYRPRNLAGYSPWGHNELGTTERLRLSLSYAYWYEDNTSETSDHQRKPIKIDF